jgi:hypothetical protein
MEDPVSGLARKLQDSIKFFTEKKLPIMVGNESAEENDSAPNLANQPNRVPASEHPALEKAPTVWHEARQSIAATITQLKEAIRKEYADAAPMLLAGVEQSVTALDVVLDKFDHRLADVLARAHAAKDPTARAAELKAAKALLTEHIQYVKSEPLIEHIDANPFGVATNLKQKLTATFMHMAQAIG